MILSRIRGTFIVTIAVALGGITLGQSTEFAEADGIPTISDKTLVAWVYLDNLTQRGGSVLTIDDQQTHFDGIVFGELSPGKWMAGSDGFTRTHQDQQAYPAETADPKTPVEIAIVYSGRQIIVYRNAREYSRHQIDEPRSFGPGSAVVIGLRHLLAGDRACIAGSVDDARIYDVALTAEQIAALQPKRPSDPSPLAWWTFDDGAATDRMGCFPPGRLVGKAHIANGRLYLDGHESFMVTPGSAVPEPPATVPEYPSPIHYRPDKGVFADPIPFFWKGEYHVFYLQGGVGKVPWKHIVSTDLVHWRDLPDALLPDGDPNGPDGEHIFTGSAIEKNGVFHIFYTGFNPRNPVGEQCIMHATSPDLITWTKHPEDLIRPDGVHYKNHHNCDWRDADVTWNEAEQQYWMVMCSDTAQGDGGVGLLTSKDLKHWQQEPSLKGADQQECPDLFRIGDTWYLIGGDHYSYAKSPRGPWRKPSISNTIDRPGVYAGKRMFDGKRHIWVGWVWEIPTHRDGEAAAWGGSQSLPRELYAGPSGQLYCKPASEIVALYGQTLLDLSRKPKPVLSGAEWRYDGGALVGSSPSAAFDVPPNYMLECEVRLEAKSVFSLAMRRQSDGRAYRLTLIPENAQATLSGPGFNYQRPCPVDVSKPIKLQVFVQGTIIECFINDQYAITSRAYNFQKGQVAFEIAQGTARVESLQVKTAPQAAHR
jgi:sucrose-6-phosphate hydrolase SacC (GH32 family)